MDFEERHVAGGDAVSVGDAHYDARGVAAVYHEEVGRELRGLRRSCLGSKS